METGKKVRLNIGDKMSCDYLGIPLGDFEIWTGRDSEEFYDPARKKDCRNPEIYE